ncbi:Hypothetical protein PHPALM_10735 [Phytophthora palmivora]|uniref:Uncharacterized protein n=1 Tax=Phytophthora palmivora TaxID=4796 RepID=A0A2P4Y3Z8_9STRA|nr:Hypothetical protein PHPALM_10735 [Phytophthora palmivora]
MTSTTSSPASTSQPPVSRSARSSRRQRVLWDSDNSTRDGKTSITILLEWLTAPGNYARWRDGKSQTGETREALCSEIKHTMRQHGIHHRENANIRTQISELERSFDGAREWLKENGYDPYTFQPVEESEEGVVVLDAPHGPAETHVLRMCRYYPVLNDIFGQDEDKGRRHRRSHHSKTATYPVPMKKRKLPEEDNDVEHEKIDPETVEEQRETVPVSAPTGTSTVPIAPSTAVSTPGLTGPWTNPAALESTQRMLAEAVREERERKRFCMEEERNKLECEKLRYEVEAAKLKLTIDRALARKKLLDAGLPEAQVNDLFPK